MFCRNYNYAAVGAGVDRGGVGSGVVDADEGVVRVEMELEVRGGGKYLCISGRGRSLRHGFSGGQDCWTHV